MIFKVSLLYRYFAAVYSKLILIIVYMAKTFCNPLFVIRLHIMLKINFLVNKTLEVRLCPLYTLLIKSPDPGLLQRN